MNDLPLIITTRRSPLGFMLDASLTAIGWVGFMYLFTEGVAREVYASHLANTVSPSSQLLSTADTLGLYLLVACINAILVALWGHYRKQLSQCLAPRAAPRAIGMDTRASQFHLSDYQLHEFENSRVIVVHHLDDGVIERLETDQLYTPDSAPQPDDTFQPLRA